MNIIFRDAWVVVVLDTVTSILAGFPVFMTMGYIATQLETSVEDVINSGEKQYAIDLNLVCGFQ